MEDKDYSFTTLSFFDMRTGEKVHEFESTLPTIVPEMSADAEPLYHFSGDLSFTIGDCDTTELWEKLVVGNSKNTTVEFDGHVPNGLVQAGGNHHAARGRAMTAKCLGCRRHWNISITRKIPPTGYICPHCAARRLWYKKSPAGNRTEQENNRTIVTQKHKTCKGM